METQTEQLSMDKLTRIYLKMRDKLRDLKAEEESIKEQQARIAAAMKDILQANGGKSMGTEHGTVSITTKTRYYAQDWDAMNKFIIENDALYLLEKRIAQTNMSEFLEANPGIVPPSLGTTSEVTVSVTKPRK